MQYSFVFGPYWLAVLKLAITHPLRMQCVVHIYGEGIMHGLRAVKINITTITKAEWRVASAYRFCVCLTEAFEGVLRRPLSRAARSEIAAVPSLCFNAQRRCRHVCSGDCHIIVSFSVPDDRGWLIKKVEKTGREAPDSSATRDSTLRKRHVLLPKVIA